MSFGAIRVSGMDEILTNLNEQVKGIAVRTKRGMITAGFLIQREAQILVPVDLNNLRSSAFTIWGPGQGKTTASFTGDDADVLSADHERVVKEEQMGLSSSTFSPEVEVGFSAFYAIFVHEDLNAKHVVGEAKFLQKAVSQNISQILAAIENEAAL